MFLRRSIVLAVFAMLWSGSAEAQWQPASGFSVGDVASFAGDDFVQYAVTGGRLFVRQNTTWEPVTAGPSDIVRIAFDNGDIYAAVFQKGIYHSSSGRWTCSTTGMSDLTVDNVVIAGNTVIAGTDGGGIFISTDKGSTWVASNTGLTSRYINALAGSASHLLAGTPEGVFQSTDAGRSWTATGKLSDPFVACVALHDSTLFAGTIDGVDGGLFRSTDKGVSWQHADAGLPNKKVHAILDSTFGLYVGTEGGLFTFMGNYWQRVGSGMTAQWIDAVAQLGTYLLVGTDQGAFISSDFGDSWQASTSGLSATAQTVRSMAVNNGALIVGTGDADQSQYGGVYLSTNGGASWMDRSGGLPYVPITAVARRGNLLFAANEGKRDGTAKRGIYRSSDNGMSWRLVDSGHTELVIMILGSHVIAGGDNDIGGSPIGYAFRYSSDSGLTWHSANDPQWGSYKEVWSFATIGSKVFAAIGDAQDGVNYVYVSSDSGVSWQNITTLPQESLPAGLSGICAIGSKLFVIGYYNQAVFMSSDEGATWTKTTDTVGRGYQVYDFVTDGTNLFAGTSGGILASTNEGKTWMEVGHGLPMEGISLVPNVPSLAIDGTTLYAGNYRGDVWKRSIPEMLGASAVAPISETAHEVMCYPNPFSTSTQITISPTTSGHADISIVNQLGVEVAHLFSGELDAGEHSFTWDTRGAGPLRPTGVYECIVRLNGQTQSLPIALLY
jgi:photosystem II stability/assembly factor-like uncharacterized protein